MAITASDVFILETGNVISFKDAPVRIYCPFAVDKDDVTAVDVQVWNDAGTVFYMAHTLRFSEAELEAFTGTGSGEFSQMKNVVEQAVKGYLEGIGDNGGVTFTIV